MMTTKSDTRTLRVADAHPDARPPAMHIVKSWPHLFEATVTGVKTHDMRRTSDRDYQVGDTLVLREYDPTLCVFTGRWADALITYITSADAPCALSDDALHQDFCILSLKLMRTGVAGEGDDTWRLRI
jgi:hypothetical protein